MRLRQLQTFARLVRPYQAYSKARLQRLIDRGELAGGLVKDGNYFVDIDTFERSWYPDRVDLTLDPPPVRRPQKRVPISPEQRREMDAYYREVDPARRLKASAAHSRKRKRIIRKATPPWADLEAIRAFYAEAQRKTLRTGIPHCVDHEIPLQGKMVCGLHVETNLRVITVQANSQKHNRFRE